MEAEALPALLPPPTLAPLVKLPTVVLGMAAPLDLARAFIIFSRGP